MNPTRTISTAALVASVILHAIAGAVVVRGLATRATKNAPAAEPRDRWAGETTEVEVGVESPIRALPAPPPAAEHGERTAVPAAAREVPARKARARTRGLEAAVATERGRAVEPAGGEDGPTARRSLARAFTRALPVANTGDPVWDRLPLGAAGSIVVVLFIDEEGKMLNFEQRETPHAPPYLVRSVERALLLLHGGHFGVPIAGAARQAFRLDVTLSDRPAETGPLALGYEVPSTGKSGRAYFQLPSGRFVDVVVSFARS